MSFYKSERVAILQSMKMFYFNFWCKILHFKNCVGILISHDIIKILWCFQDIKNNCKISDVLKISVTFWYQIIQSPLIYFQTIRTFESLRFFYNVIDKYFKHFYNNNAIPLFFGENIMNDSLPGPQMTRTPTKNTEAIQIMQKLVTGEFLQQAIIL